MYPKTEDELRGWNVSVYDCGAAHNVVHADSSLISWGSGCQCGELGLGVDGKKSSANPAKVDSLDGVKVAQIACGVANTILLVEADATVDGLPEFTPVEPAAGEAEPAALPEEEEQAPKKPKGGKRAAEPAASKGKKKAKE